ncbi:MAG: DNA mismatch repair protein MutS [Firmicutes bacterium]|nr:DNA mismatch repair protein MutS [Bacillota bacterium]
MNVFLMYPTKDFTVQDISPNESALIQDLELSALWNAMAAGDQFVWTISRQVTLSPLVDLDVILYRQDILNDCVNQESVVRDIYAIAATAIEREKKNYLGLFSSYPSAILQRSVDVMQMFVETLEQLKHIAQTHAHQFVSSGFSRFFTMLINELGEEYLDQVKSHLRELKFRKGVWISAALGPGNKATRFRLHRTSQTKKSPWIARIMTKTPRFYTYTIADRDDTGARALAELRDRGIYQVANVLAQSTDHVLNFFTLLKTELAFYMGCLTLHKVLAQKEEPLCFPVPAATTERLLSVEGLYDVCLSLRQVPRVVGNTVKADGKDMVIITPRNQGGKSTFLRSIGLAQLMMQCGMFVPAESFQANICNGLFTHFKREEDVTMNSGKLDEELHRMSEIVDQLKANSLVLFNESFAATNEREGSEIARQIVSALVEKHVQVFFVTHLYELAAGLYQQQRENFLFLQPQRLSDGERTFKLEEGKPLQTSFGEDLYHRIFGAV